MKEQHQLYQRYASIRLQDRGVKITEEETKKAFRRLSEDGFIACRLLKYFLVRTKIKIFGDHAQTTDENIKDFLSIIAPDGNVDYNTFKESITSFPFMNMLINRVAGFTEEEIKDIISPHLKDEFINKENAHHLSETNKVEEGHIVKVECEICKNFHKNNHFKSKKKTKCTIF